MSLYKRKHGEEQPFWPIGKYKLRLPLIHYRLETPELIQGVVIFTIGLSMIEIMTNVVGMSYTAALTITIFQQFLMLLPSTLGIPLVSGFITPLLPVIVVFLGNYEPGPEAIQALIAVQMAVAAIFLILGVTGLGKVFITKLPNSLKAGILIGAGLAAILGEIGEGSRLAATPITLTIGGILCIYIMFSNSFKNLYKKYAILKFIASYGIMPAIIAAIIIGWMIGEYATPTIEWGITIPVISEMWNVSPFVAGFPTVEMFAGAIPTAILAYIIAYGDIVVGEQLVKRARESRDDEKITYDLNHIHVTTSIRNFLHAFFMPHPGLAGPIFTAGTASVVERYTFGRKAMDSIFSGTNSLLISLSLAIFILPLVTLFQPFLPIALSITLVLTGYLCLTTGIQQVKSETEIGVAGIMAIVLAVYGAAHGLVVGLVLYFLIQRASVFGRADKDKEDKEEKAG